MPMQLLRQLEAEHKSIWDHLSQPKPEMVVANDCEPVLLSGWTDKDISLWDVSAVDGKPSLKDILVALCRNNKKSWDRISYLLFPEDTVSLAGLSLTSSNGNTGIPRVDQSKTHFEIKGISGKELCTLLFHVSRSEFVIGVFKKKELESILYEAFDKTATIQVVESATSQPTYANLPPSGTGGQATTTGATLEQALSETPTTEQVSRPSSSTTQE